MSPPPWSLTSPAPRHKMKEGVSGIKTFSFGQDLVFEAFVQFKEYIGFVKVRISFIPSKYLL